MKEDKSKEKTNKIGRPPAENPAAHMINFRLNDAEKVLFDQIFRESGIINRSKYIQAILFEREIKVVTIDKATMDYYIRLTNFYHQYQAIGNNYNQTVVVLKKNFGERRALQMLYKLEKATFELVVLSKQIIALTREYEEKWLKK